MVREMTTRYGRSWGGYFWAIIEPVGMIAVLSVAFSEFLRTPPLGNSFILFYSAGYIPFTFYMSINTMTSAAVGANRSLMKYPMVSPMDTVLARAILQTLTLIVVTFLIILGLSYLVDEPITLSIWNFILAILAAVVLGLGGGTLNVVLFAFFPIYRHVWAIVSRPLFIVSGIFYTVESMPTTVQNILVLNPLVHVTAESHKAFYPIYDGDFVTLAYPFSLGIFFFLLGGTLMLRHRSFIIENS
ncbi:MAG: ABC transporter permease [Silicimonas sp.]|jgi:capsular polysaccharide transport system permease protein|nr:ABC transporter permease [Silicimonas sp.]